MIFIFIHQKLNLSDVIRLTTENKINLDIRSKIFENSFQIENYLKNENISK